MTIDFAVKIIDDGETQYIDDWDYYKEMKAKLMPAKVLKIRRENAGFTQTERTDVLDCEVGNFIV